MEIKVNVVLSSHRTNPPTRESGDSGDVEEKVEGFYPVNDNRSTERMGKTAVAGKASLEDAATVVTNIWVFGRTFPLFAVLESEGRHELHS